MTIISTRTKLQQALDTDGCTILIISDDPDSNAEHIHDKAEDVAKDWQYVFLVTNLGMLKPAERKAWFDEEGHYAVIGGTNKVVAVRGPLSDFLLPDGTASGIEIRWAFAQGDRLP